jgi:hypothetical protein
MRHKAETGNAGELGWQKTFLHGTSHLEFLFQTKPLCFGQVVQSSTFKCDGDLGTGSRKELQIGRGQELPLFGCD